MAHNRFLKDLMKTAIEEQGATEDTAALELFVRVNPAWFRWLVTHLPFIRIEGVYSVGQMKDGVFWYNSTWTAGGVDDEGEEK